jgi:hypothetical protein
MVTEEAVARTPAGEAGTAQGEPEEAAAPAQAGEGASSSVLPILGAVARRPMSAASERKLRAGALRALQGVAPLRASAAVFLALLQRRGGLRLGQAPVLPCAPDAAGAVLRPSVFFACRCSSQHCADLTLQPKGLQLSLSSILTERGRF